MWGGQVSSLSTKAQDQKIVKGRDYYIKNGIKYVKYSTTSSDLVIHEDYTVEDYLHHVSNPNLLINGDFRNPVNQRNKTTYLSSDYGTSSSKVTYTIDRWGLFLSTNIWKFSIVSGGLKFIQGTNVFYQYLEAFVIDLTKTYTFSVCMNGKIYSETFKADTPQHNTAEEGLSWWNYRPKGSGGFVYHRIGIRWYDSSVTKNADGSVLIQWAKLEEGTIRTPLVPRNYFEELVLCQRYYLILGPSIRSVYFTDTTAKTVNILGDNFATMSRKPSVTCYDFDDNNRPILAVNVTPNSIRNYWSKGQYYALNVITYLDAELY